nr:Cna B-type domain-containing protein [uncultured Blautia sp.]
MKKNGYLRKFIAMFLVFVMLMADSSMTTFANSFTVGRVKQQNADEGVAVQSSNDVNVTVNAPDGTYYVKLKQKENEWWASDIARASVQVQNGKGTCSLNGSNLDGSKENWLEIGLQENGSFVKSGEVLRSEGKIYSVTESNHAFTVNEISIQPGTQRNFKDILGSATNFGIVANEATFKGHLESNFAIGKLNYEGSNVQMSKNEGGGAGYNYIGEFVGSSQLQIGLNGNAGGSVVYAGKGAEGKLTTDNSDLLIDYDTYTEAQIKKIVKDMVDTIKTTSTTLYNENSVPYSAVTDISTSGNQYTDINIAKYGKDAGTYYVSFQPGEFNTFMSNPNRRITIREDQNIVLNVPDTNVDFRQFTFVIVDASGNVVYQKTTNANSDEDRVAENVIFNCPNATTAATYTSTGIFLVPNATFTNALVSAGWVIANTIAAIGGQEWHNVYKGMPIVETTFQIKATKNVDNAPATDEKYDGKFSFELQEKNGENWKTIDSVTNTGSAIVFDNLGKFGTEGTHYYKIVETASALSDVTIDGEPVYVKAVIKKNGNKMVATVTYYSDENYATEVSDPSFNNTTVITEKTEVSVEKKWADNENQDRVRPGSIQVQLYADETAQGDPIELNEDNGWKYTWSNLEKKSGSNDIEYTVDEVSVPAGYTKTVIANEGKTEYTITNTHTTETTEATVRKVWNDSNDQDGKRPDSLNVNLMNGNTVVDTVTLTADNNWTATVQNLPKKANGTDIVYSWSEGNMPEGYSLTDTAKDGTVTTLTNSYSTEETSVSVRKVWTDSDNQDGIRPESISVQLKADGKASGDPVVLNEANTWTYTWTKLAKNANKTEIQYTVDEVDVPSGYTKTVTKESTGYVITNTHNPETTSINGTKTWSDNDNQDGKRPTSITVNLLANGTKVDSKEVTANDNWKYEFTNLPKYAAGNEITYTVEEDAVEGYEATVDGYNITNTHKPETTKVEGTKTWNDSDNQDGIRPEKIIVNLLADGNKVNTQEVTPDDNGNWTYSFTDLPKYKAGKEIKYRVEEVAVEGYTTELDGYDIYNTHTPETTIIEGTKSWNDKDNQDGKRPEKIIVNLLANGEKVDTQVVTADNDWKYSFKDLPVYKDGQKLTYTVSEETVKDYTTEYDGTNIINSYTPGKTSASVVKVWNDANNQDGKRPESITVSLLADGRDTGITVTLNAENNWTQTVTDLDEKANGKAIKYTWAEENVPKGYELTGNTTKGTLTTLTNKHVPEVTSISGTKTWNDNDNQDGKRPTSITVNLLADGTVYASQTVTAATNWKYTFDNLPVNKNGTAINYAIGEVEVTDYTTEIDEYDIINTHTPETTSVSGQKVWDDANNQDGKRPESIKVRLLANGTEVATKDVTAADNWAYNFTDLSKYANGEEIVYTVTEDAVADYTTAIDGTTITNSYKPGKTSITVTKAWADNDNQDGIRPENIKVQLYAGETAQGEEVTLSADNNWTYTWSELDAKKDGQDIVYTVRETEVPAGYEAIVTGTAAEGFILTNTHETEVISVEGTKTWNDNDQTTKRPESITVRLLADGKEAGNQKVTADSNWTYKFAELPKYAAGKEIVYTVSEDAVPGYITSVNGNNLINTITSVKVSKVDITDHKELAGAHIQILDKDGNIIDEWDSTWEAHEVTGLKTNEQYTLRETVAPDGYTVTSDTTFTLKEDGTVDKDNTQTTVSDDGTLLVEDSKTSVKVSKVDIADGKELEGAHIQVIDEDENIVAEWDSTKEPHVIEGLKTDKKYILRETVAPTGYELTNDTTFVLKADGTVDTEKTTTVSKDGVLLVQDKLATGQSIAVTKKLTTITGDLRAMDQTFYVALYSDEACTQRVSDVKAIEFKNASSSTVVFNENIEVNKDYYIAECSQDGTAQSMGALADGTMYEAKFNNGNKATVKEANGTTTVYFDNVFSSIPDGYYKQGKLTITKKLLGADGNAKKSDNVFYAGIFDDADYTQLSTQVSQNIVKLDLAGGSEVSQVIKIGLDVNKTVTLYVTETDSNGKPVAGTSGFAYKVSVDGSTVTIDEANENASVTITNTENPTTTKTTTEESGNESGSSASSHSMSSSTKAPKTGDDTPIAMYVIILIAAAALIVFGFEKRRRSNRK